MSTIQNEDAEDPTACPTGWNWIDGSAWSDFTFSTGLLAPTGLPSRTILDWTYSAQWFFIFSYFSFLLILGRAVDEADLTGAH